MNPILLYIVTALYFGQAVLSAWGGNLPLALMLLGFTVGNIGMIWGAA